MKLARIIAPFGHGASLSLSLYVSLKDIGGSQ